MFSKSHQGIVKKTVVLEFENGYKITLEAGVEMSMHLVMDEKQIESIHPKGVCWSCKQKLSLHGVCLNDKCEEDKTLLTV